MIQSIFNSIYELKRTIYYEYHRNEKSTNRIIYCETSNSKIKIHTKENTLAYVLFRIASILLIHEFSFLFLYRIYIYQSIYFSSIRSQDIVCITFDSRVAYFPIKFPYFNQQNNFFSCSKVKLIEK